MTCSRCGGEVLWKGPLVNLTHTECSACGAINSQVPNPEQCTECLECIDDCTCSDFDVTPDMGDK
jgi:hypothetical protein